MATKSNTNTMIKDYFKDIRRIIKTAHRDIDRTYADAARKRSTAHVERYEADFRQEWERKLNSEVMTSLSAIRSVATSQIDSLFMLIKEEMSAWMSEPLDSSLSQSLETFTRFELDPSVEEFRGFLAQGQGNYLAGRILDMMGRKKGIVTGFVPIETLQKDLRAAQADSKTAITHYVGRLDENRHFAGQEFENTGENWYLYPFAESYLTREDSSLARIETELLDMTVKGVDLLPSTRHELDKIFDGADDQRKVAIAVNLLDTGDRLADLLQVYDAKLYQSAQDAIDQAAKDRALQAMQNYTQARDAAQKAIQASAAASRRQESVL